jgi:chitin disaccharide deacetylase
VSANRQLIVNADDFGQSPGINRGVIRAHEQGIVTSASLMVRWPAAAEAAEYARERPQLSMGLHVDLAEWAYRSGEWRAIYQRAAPADAAEVSAEFDAQLELFRILVGREPTHLDSHQHAHMDEQVRPLALERAERLRIPLRGLDRRIRYVGAFYGQLHDGRPHPSGITVCGLIETIRALPQGVTELACHPAATVDFRSMYSRERVQELESLCDPRVRARIAEANVRLVSFDAFA